VVQADADIPSLTVCKEICLSLIDVFEDVLESSLSCCQAEVTCCIFKVVHEMMKVSIYIYMNIYYNL
jgi:hypothetical protein